MWDSGLTGYLGRTMSEGLGSLIPTKTSRVFTQLGGMFVLCWRVGSHVSFILLVRDLSFCRIARLRSMLRRVLSFPSHLVVISSAVCCRSAMTRSHLITQIRCMDSDIRMRRSRACA